MASVRASPPTLRPLRVSRRLPQTMPLQRRREIPRGPSNRSSRALATPAVSAPAKGWPPTKRGSEIAPTIARLVEPTSLSTHSEPAASRASRVGLRRRPDRCRYEHHVGIAHRIGDRKRRLVDRAQLDSARQRARLAVVAARRTHRCAGARPGRSSPRSARPRAPPPHIARPRCVNAFPASAAALCTAAA